MRRNATALAGMLCGVPLAAMAQTAGQASETRSYQAHLAAATLSYDAGEPDEARRWLMAAPSGPRGWEWAHVDVLLDQSDLVTDTLAATPLSIDLDPAAKRAAISLSSGRIVIWDFSRNQVDIELAGHPGGTFVARFSPDGGRLASAGVDRIARIWDLQSREATLEFKEHKFPVTSVVFTHDGSRVYSSAYYTDKSTAIEGRVHLWDAKTGEIVRTYKGGVKPLSSLALSPDARWLAAGSWDSGAYLWEADADGEPRKFGPTPEPKNVYRVDAISFSPDSSLLALASDEKWVRVYRTGDGAQVASLDGHTSEVKAVQFSPDGKLLVSGGDDGLRLWNVNDWSARAMLCGHTKGVRSVAWPGEGATFYSAGLDKTLRKWDANFPAYGGVHARYGNNNYSVKFDSAGASLACSSSDGTIGLVDSHTGRETARWKTAHTREVCTAAISPDRKQIASCSWDRTIRVHDMGTGEQTAVFELPAGAALIAWRPNGAQLAAGLQDKSAVLVDVASGKVLRAFVGHTRDVKSVDFDATGERLATSSGDGTVRVWNVETGAAICTMSGHKGPIESAVFSRDGRHVVSGGNDGSVRLWDAASGREIRTLLESDDTIYRVATAPHGRIAVGGKYLYICDPTVTGALLRSKPLPGTIWHLDWSPDGHRLAVGDWNGGIVVYSDARGAGPTAPSGIDPPGAAR